jgi:glucose-6-phosphate dehydrogenase assembly protein OpcA
MGTFGAGLKKGHMVRPEEILKELSRLWVDLGHQQQEETPAGETGDGVLRACAMTLITIADESEDPTDVGETVARLIEQHPSRSVMIRLRESNGETLESRVFAQCWMPFGQRRQICCEQVEITASLSSLDDVPGIVLPLAVPDLPVILWCRSPRLFDTPAFPRIAAMSDKLIVDTGAFDDLGHALDLVFSQLTAGRLIADLAWTRTTRWRESVSQIFGNADCLAALTRYTRAKVSYGAGRLQPEALYLAAWLGDGLTRVGNATKVELVPGTGPAVSGVALEGAGACDVIVESDENGAVEIRSNNLSDKMIFPPATDYFALQEELSITNRDPVFEAAMPVARDLFAQMAK